VTYECWVITSTRLVREHSDAAAKSSNGHVCSRDMPSTCFERGEGGKMHAENTTRGGGGREKINFEEAPVLNESSSWVK